MQHVLQQLCQDSKPHILLIWLQFKEAGLLQGWRYHLKIRPTVSPRPQKFVKKNGNKWTKLRVYDMFAVDKAPLLRHKCHIPSLVCL